MTDSFKVQLYILGYLIRHGPLHGYQIKARIEEEAADFAHVKLPNLYYHLGRMEERGWLLSRTGREGGRSEKEVYSISKAGRGAFAELKDRCLEEEPVWDFAAEGALFFIRGGEGPAFTESFARGRSGVEAELRELAAREAGTLAEVPEPFREVARLIFEHHSSIAGPSSNGSTKPSPA